ncbi:HNH endonuclease, putative [Spiroplasma citri]|nr:HNH endonuclease, putative [Spiroplasma citri]
MMKKLLKLLMKCFLIKKMKNNWKDYDKNRPIRHKFYRNKKWVKIRNDYFNSKMGICERCYQKRYIVNGVIVHHKEYITDQDFINWNIDKLFAWKNLELLCMKCHNKEHKTEKGYRDNVIIDEKTGKVKIIDKEE